MKKARKLTRRSLSIWIALLVSLTAIPTYGASSCPPAQHLLAKLFQQPATQFIILQSGLLDNGLCEAVVRHRGMFEPRLFVYSQDGKYAFFGTIVKTADAKPWGRDLLARYSKLNPKVVASLRDIAIHVGQSKNRVIMITDPLCSFCKEIMEKLKPLVQQNRIGLDIVFATIHKGSLPLAIDLLCTTHKDFIDAYLNAPELLKPQNRKKLVSCAGGAATLGEMGGILKTIGVQATPTFILERNDRVITGVVPVEMLLPPPSRPHKKHNG